MEHLLEMAYGESNGHVLIDVTWPTAGGRHCERLAEIALLFIIIYYFFSENKKNSDFISLYTLCRYPPVDRGVTFSQKVGVPTFPNSKKWRYSQTLCLYDSFNYLYQEVLWLGAFFSVRNCYALRWVQFKMAAWRRYSLYACCFYSFLFLCIVLEWIFVVHYTCLDPPIVTRWSFRDISRQMSATVCQVFPRVSVSSSSCGCCWKLAPFFHGRIFPLLYLPTALRFKEHIALRETNPIRGSRIRVYAKIEYVSVRVRILRIRYVSYAIYSIHPADLSERTCIRLPVYSSSAL